MKSILVIEDEAPLRESLVDILQFENFTVFEAENGLEGIRVARDRKPDLIICDVAMPELDGFAAVEELRQDPETAAIPVIFLTANTDEDSIRRGVELGAAAYLPKPFTFCELLSAIHALLD